MEPCSSPPPPRRPSNSCASQGHQDDRDASRSALQLFRMAPAPLGLERMSLPPLAQVKRRPRWVPALGPRVGSGRNCSLHTTNTMRRWLAMHGHHPV
ncbi:hypothetical protein IF1G_05112 [Cordyceps javanica]|uniref:Uncharacterized protein n=1 Tax=Cordyceps javanica TaxID=43265 RepID=A0A545V486_9HYPO|nr:hypothetical protein IF1G_05112 [Cordyceps javanica]TQW07813.1 hypothetical protein IF2G_04974 [Cordyceps javanica]